MTDTDRNDFTEQLTDRLVDIMLEEGIGGRPTPDLRDAVMHTVTRNRRIERVTVLALAAGIAAVLAALTPRLLNRNDRPATDNIARQDPRPIPQPDSPPVQAPATLSRVPPGEQRPTQPTSPPYPAARLTVAAIPREHITEARHRPSAVTETGTTITPPPAELSEAQWKELPVVEAHLLAQADRNFNIRKYRSATDSYDSFVAAYPRSTAITYALLRKGLALQLDGKPLEAIHTYEHILDYFPASIEFAAPALFRIGECRQQTGDEEHACKAWLEMVADPDYGKHRLAACAGNNLADVLWRQAKPEQALVYYRDVAHKFRRTSPDSGLHAAQQVARYYVLIEPDEQKLREWYRDIGGLLLEPNMLATNTDPAQLDAYWQTILQVVREWSASCPEAQAHLKRKCLTYWIEVLDLRMPRKEELRIALADLRREHTGDTAGWVREMDSIFASGYITGDTDRVLRWIDYYRELPDPAARYCAMIEPAGKAVTSLDDITKARLALRLGACDAAAAQKIIAGIDDNATRLTTLVDYYHALGPDAGDKGFPLNLDHAALPTERLRAADALARIEGQAGHALWTKAQFLHWDKRYTEAVTFYRMADNPPDNLWQIVECYRALGEWEAAIRELAGIETSFKDQAPRAALMQAEIYAGAGKKDMQIAKLRRVMMKYSTAAEAGTAHRQLESFGVAIGGGLDAEDDGQEEVEK